MASRTQLVCLCEGKRGRSIDEVFINAFVRAFDPKWIRKQGSNWISIKSCGGRTSLIDTFPNELRKCLTQGSSTTLMVWADCDDDCADPEVLKEKFWLKAKECHIDKNSFDQVVFVFAKDRLENWVEHLQTGTTNEADEGPRVHPRVARDAARKLAKFCKVGKAIPDMPASLAWSCENWRELTVRMTSSH